MLWSGGGLKQFWKSRWMGEGETEKTCAFHRGGVDFFWNNPFQLVFIHCMVSGTFLCVFSH